MTEHPKPQHCKPTEHCTPDGKYKLGTGDWQPLGKGHTGHHHHKHIENAHDYTTAIARCQALATTFALKETITVNHCADKHPSQPSWGFSFAPPTTPPATPDTNHKKR